MDTAITVRGIGFRPSLLIMLGAWLSTLLLAVLAAAFLAALVFGAVARNEIFLLCAVLAGFVVSANYEAGFQIQEVFYGLLYFGYLTYWFLSRFFFYRDPVLKTPIDWALFFFFWSTLRCPSYSPPCSAAT